MQRGLRRVGFVGLALVAVMAVAAAPATAKKKKKKKTVEVTKTASVNTCVSVTSPILSPNATGGPSAGRAQIPVTVPPLRGQPQAGTVTAFRSVDVRLDHTFNSDLAIFLISPGGASVPLAVGRGDTSDGYGSGLNSCGGNRVFFGDAFATPISSQTTTPPPTLSPITGFFRPESPLSALVGGAAGGTWTLLVIDPANNDNGTLGAFSLDFTYSYKELLVKKVKKKKKKK